MGKITINQDALKPRREWKRHKIVDGENIYRILPPFGDVSTHNNWPFKKWTVIWNLIDPKTGRTRPFGSPMLTEKRCPVTEYIDALSKKAEVMKSELQAKGLSEKQLKEAMKMITSVVKDFRPKHTYAYNAANKAGEVGILELKPTAHKEMQKEMMQYIKDYNQDPTSLLAEDDDSGVWFKISRTGQSFETEYGVTKNQTKQKTSAGLVFVDDRSALPENVVENYQDLGYDLGSVYQIKGYDELKEILLLNIKHWTKGGKENKELLVPGFDNLASVGKLNLEGEEAEDVADEPAEEEQVAPVKGKTRVALKVEQQEEVEMSPRAKAKAVDDVFAMADSILGDD